MTFTAAQIAQLINGKLTGKPDVEVASFGKIEEAKEGQLAFLANPKYEDHLYTTSASVVIINDTLELKQPVQATLIAVPDAYTAFAALLARYQEIAAQQMKGIEQPSFIHPTARTGQDVFVGAFSYLGEQVVVGDNTKIYPQVYLGKNVRIGNNTVLHPGVKIYHDCTVGSNTIIHAGTVLGSDGFGYAPQADGSYRKVPQIGNVVVEDFVEIGANTTIDRATIGSTVIRSGVKLDNLVQVAHNVEIGAHTAIAAQAGISGSTKIGRNVLIGGQAGLAGHLHIADGSKINAQSGVGKSLKPRSSVTGSPAYEYGSAMRSLAVSRRLPEMERRLAALEQLIQKLTANS